MRIECPHCHNRLNLVDVESAEQAVSDGSAACPSCGSVIPALDMTVTQKAKFRDMVGHFALIGKVGIGQFGTVWRARDTRLNRTVAVKIPRDSELDEKQRDMFLREAQAAAGLNHEGIVRTLEVGEHEGCVFIVSDFINGITLAEKMAQDRLKTTEATEIIRRVSEAVHHAHEHHVIHRDLKPSNILIDIQGHPFVSDFGLAKQETGEVTMTVTGMILGTPAYMSPEQAGGFSNKADARSDVYSLGVILYELLTGEKPFKGSTAVLLHEIQSKDPRAPRAIEKTIPRDLETICLKALEKRPDRRYQTARELAEDLARYLSGDSIKARRVRLIERLARKARRNKLTTFSLSVASIALGLVAFTYLPNSPPPPPVPPGALYHKELWPAGADLTVDKYTMDIQCDSVVGAVLFRNIEKPTYLLNYELIQNPLKGNFSIVFGYSHTGFHLLNFHRRSETELGVSLHKGTSLKGGFALYEAEAVELEENDPPVICTVFVSEGRLTGLWVNDKRLDNIMQKSTAAELDGAFGIRADHCRVRVKLVRQDGGALIFSEPTL